MRTVIGWMAAMLASALLGAAVYQTVLSKPLPELDPTATVETITGEPGPQPTIYRTESRTVVEPTPTVTVEDEVVIEEVVQVSQPRTSSPAPARTSAPKPKPRATAEREKSEASESSDDSDAAEKAAKEAEDAAERATEEAEGPESDD